MNEKKCYIYTVEYYLTIEKNKRKLLQCTLAWKIPWTEEPGRLQSMGTLRVGHNWATSLFTFHFHALEKEMTTHSSVLAWRIPGTGEPGGLPSMGSHRVGHDWSDLAAAAGGTENKWTVPPLLNFLPSSSLCSFLFASSPGQQIAKQTWNLRTSRTH